MNRRARLRSALGGAAAALGFGRFATPAQAQTKHIRLYVEMDIAPVREQEMLDTFHNMFVPLEFESDEFRQKWIASAAHQRVWPPVEKTMTTQKIVRWYFTTRSDGVVARVDSNRFAYNQVPCR